MKYRITPANLFLLFVLGMFLYFKINEVDINTTIGISYIAWFSIFVFIVDFFLQYLVSNYRKIFIVEFVSLPIIILVINFL